MSEETAAEGVDLLDELGTVIEPPDTVAEDAARARLGADRLAGLGALGRLALWWASVRGGREPAPPSAVLFADGSRAPGLLAAGRTDLQQRRIPRDGSVDAALEWGIATADDAADRGVDLIVLSLDEPQATRALAADLMGLDAVEGTGWPMDRGMDDETWMDAVTDLRDRLRRTRGLRGKPATLLRALGDPAVAAASALLVQSAARRTPVLLDGPGAAAAALLARRTCFAASDWWQAAHLTEDGLHERSLGSLGLEPLTRLKVTVEDGTTVLAGLALLDLAAGLLTAPADPAAPDDPAAPADPAAGD